MASEYGWTTDYILRYVTLPELYKLQNAMKSRKSNEYILELLIEHNPHTEKPNLLYRQLLNMGGSEISETIDRTGIDELKNKLRKSKLIQVKQ